MKRIVASLEALSRFVRTIGPFLLVELLLPGGTLIALLLWLSRSGRLQAAARTFRDRVTAPACARIVEVCASVAGVCSADEAMALRVRCRSGGGVG